MPSVVESMVDIPERRWSPQQIQALDAVARWRRSGDPLFRLFGYAGTGKTTLAIQLAGDIPGVLFGAYTGKAALVMQKKGCLGAQTLHSLIYKPIVVYACKDHPKAVHTTDKCSECGKALKPRRSPNFVLNHNSPLASASLLIIDECSMVDERMGRDLLSFGCPILVLGDPEQLPPIRGEGYFTEARPDVMLTEIHRQAKGDPIIELATRARERMSLIDGRYGQSSVSTRSPNDPLPAIPSDEVMMLAGTHVLRHTLNAQRRKVKGFTDPMPVIGDRLVCLRNNHAKGLLNGGLWDVSDIKSYDESSKGLELSLLSDDGRHNCDAFAAVDPFREVYPPEESTGLDEFTYGYALTVHKAQGSQWDDVVLFDQSHKWGTDASRWLYTGITRAAKRVAIIRLDDRRKGGGYFR